MKNRLVFVKLFAALVVAALVFSALSVHGTVAAPLPSFTNGGFETGDWSGWTSPNDTVTPPTVFQNVGLSGPPFGWSSISRQNGGTNLSAIVGPGLDPLTDNKLNQVHFGNWAARLNSENGANFNANAMRQTFTVVAGDVQADGSIHVTFSYAPVMQDPGHPVEGQPYFFTGVKNLTTDTVLYETFFTANQPGFPWQLALTGWYYMDWQQVDVVSAPSNPVIAVGDQIEVEVIAAGCAAGGHAGYVYVDDLGTNPPAAGGPTITLVTPISGPETGGTVVTITGTNLDTVKALYIGSDSVLPAAFTTQTATTIVFTTPGDPAGLVNITLVSDVGPAVALKSFEYLAKTSHPSITAISVTHGPVTGGTIVVLTGTNLNGAGRRVTFGDVEATCSSNEAGTQLTCTSPAHDAGPVNISISTQGGRDTFSSVFFTYDPVVPGTGFAPNRVTTLPAQTVSYADLGDLWMEIPALGVQMPIVGVPQTNGAWDVSWLGNQAGWLNGSTFPTWAGNSVLTAHVYDANGNPGPFAGLNRLWYGSQVIVHAWGGQYVYAVRSVMQVAPGDTAAMMKHQELPWLTLVTCRGYDQASNSYKYRVLVRAVLVEVK